MSAAECMIWVDQDLPLDVTSKAILSKLAPLANEDDCSWMTIEELAKRVGASERTIQSRLRMLEGFEAPEARAARIEAGQPDPVVYLRKTGECYRYGTRDVPYYELMVDYDLVAEVQRARKDRKRAHAEVRSMGATVCTHRPKAKDAVCTPMGATVCTPKREPTESQGSLTLTLSARAPETVAEEVLAAWPEGYRQRSSVREIASALRRERKRGSDIERVAAGCVGYVGNRKAWGATDGPVAPHKLIDSGRWETSAPAATPQGSPGKRTGFAVPSAVRAAFVADNGSSGEALAKSYLDPCGWRDADQTLLARTGAAERWLRERGYRVERLNTAEGVR